MKQRAGAAESCARPVSAEMSEETSQPNGAESPARQDWDDGLPAEVRRDLQILQWIRGVRWAGGAVLLGLYVALIPAVLRWVFRSAEPPEGVLTLVATALAFVLPLLLLHRRTADRVARLADRRFVGPLLLAVADSRWGMAEVRTALVSLLAQMRPQDYARLTRGHRRAIRRVLALGSPYLVPLESWLRPYADVQIALLGMLRQCGGEELVTPVRRLASEAPNRRVRSAAQECLQYLQARLEEERPTAKLLRPAEAPDGATLLRPAQASPETPEEQLLRPAAPGDGGVAG